LASKPELKNFNNWSEKLQWTTATGIVRQAYARISPEVFFMSALTLNKIIEAIATLPPQERVKLRQWLNRTVVDEAPNQGAVTNGNSRNTADENTIPPIVMRRVPPIAPERGVKKEMKWLREHRAEYANQWVALDEDRLISAGSSAKEVHAAAKAAGVRHALIVLVEPPDTPPFAGF
jgi:hypothetical protein